MRAVAIAMIDVIVIVVPVLNAPRSALFVDSCFFSNLVVRSMSVSTEYPISIRKATMPAVESLMPMKLTSASVMTMSAKAESITAKAGTEFLM